MRDGNNFHRAREEVGEIEHERERSRERDKVIARERREMRTRKKSWEREEKKKERGEVPLSIARRREVTKLFSVAIISPSHAWKRGTRKEAHERGKNSPLHAHTCDNMLVKHENTLLLM